MLRVLGRGGVPLVAIIALACSHLSGEAKLRYTPLEFRAALVHRRPGLRPADVEVPFELGAAAIALGHETIESVELGLPRIRALVDMLHRPPPEGLGLRYDPHTTRTAAETLVLRRGNCVSLASVLVGLGRGLGWPIYYAEARTPGEEVLRQENLSIRADHMVVVIISRTVRAVIDFTGPLEGYGVRVIDDMRAYAHLVNNRAAERIVEALERGTPPPWEEAQAGFALATTIQPELARAWNNRGVALARLGRLEEARGAYARALSSDTGFDSAQHNLVVLETRARGAPAISERVESGRP